MKVEIFLNLRKKFKKKVIKGIIKYLIAKMILFCKQMVFIN